MNLKNLKKQFGKDYHNRIKNLTVRECDEEEKGFFVAYVDHEKKSYDVNLKVDSKNEIVNSTCDCDQGNMLCDHQLALIDYVATLKNGGKVKKETPKISKSKVSAIRQQLNDIPETQLLNWLEEALSKDKKLKLQFELEFTREVKKTIDLKELLKETEKVVKPFSDRGKVVSTAQMKPLIELWKKLHQPFVDEFLINPILPDSIHKYNDLVIGLQEVANQYYFEGSRFDGYLKFRNKELVKSLYLIVSRHKVFESLAKGFGSEFDKTYVDFIEISELFFYDLSAQDQASFIDSICKAYKKAFDEDRAVLETCTLFVYYKLKTPELKDRFLSRLLPVRFQNEYNIELLSQIKKLGQWKKLAAFSNWIIDSNYYEFYNEPYYFYLAEALAKLGMEKERLEVLKRQLNLTYDFSIFQEIYSSMNDETERKMWRNSMMAKARAASKNNNLNATIFSLELVYSEKNFNKLFEYIPLNFPVQFLISYWDDLIKNDAEKLVNVIFNRLIGYDWNLDSGIKEMDSDLFPLLYAKLKEDLGFDNLRMLISKTLHGKFGFTRVGSFALYVLNETQKK